jgi:hypothetical protein
MGIREDALRAYELKEARREAERKLQEERAAEETRARIDKVTQEGIAFVRD